jgi:two-component system, NtrC family, response regulator AtoC
MARGILMIEDEEILAKNVKRYLERRGYDIILAGTAAEGIRLFDKAELDLVLLDLNLPDQHGLKVLEEIRRRDARVKVVCVTGDGGRRDESRRSRLRRETSRAQRAQDPRR